MGRIPFPGNVSVLNNLVNATRIEVARAGKQALVLTARIPQNMEDWVVALHSIFSGIGVPDDEVLFFVDRLLVLLTSCPERRLAEYAAYSRGRLSAPRRDRTNIRPCWPKASRDRLWPCAQKMAAREPWAICCCNCFPAFSQPQGDSIAC